MQLLMEEKDEQINEKTEYIFRKTTSSSQSQTRQMREEEEDDLQFVRYKFKSYIAFKSIKSMKSLKNLIKGLWIYPNQINPTKLRENYLNVLENYNAKFIVSDCRVSQINNKTKQYLRKNPQIGFEIWFKEDQVLQHKQFKRFQEEAKRNKIKVQYIYCNQADQKAKKKFKMNKNNKTWSFVSYGTNDINELKLVIFERNAFPNFVCLSTQKKLVNILKMGLSLIIRQPIQLNFAMDKLEELVVDKWNQEQRANVKKFIKKYKKTMQYYNKNQPKQQNKKIKSILTRYTVQDFLHKFTNSALRVWRYPTELFNLQPLIKSFFEEIKQNYKKNDKYKKLFKNGVATFYRGATVPQYELENFRKNEGKFICSLGFTSTSTNKQIAKSFVKNALIKIIVYERERDDETDHGFAKPQSSHNQQEYIFNTLNIFRILKAKYNQVQCRWDIQLIYGQFAEYLYLYDNKIKEMPQNLIQNAVVIKHLALFQRHTSKVKDQLDILVRGGECERAIKYCQAKIKFVSAQLHSQAQIIQCQKELIQVYLSFQKFQEAEKLLQKIIPNLNQQDQKIQDVVLCKLYGQTLFGLGKITKNQKKRNWYYEQAYNKLKDCLDLMNYSQKQNQFNIQESLMSALDRKKLNNSFLRNQYEQQQKQISQILNSLSNVTYQMGLMKKQNNLIKESQNYSYKSIILSGIITDHHSPQMIKRQFIHALRYKNYQYPYLRVAIQNYLSCIEAQDGQNVANYINFKLLFTLYQLSEQREDQRHDRQKIKDILREMDYFYKKAILSYTPAQKNQYFYLRACILSIIQDQPQTQTLDAYKSVLQFMDNTKKNTLKQAWINLQIGHRQKSKKHLKIGIEILEQLQSTSNQNFDNKLLKIRALNKLLDLYTKDNIYHSAAQLQKLFQHLIQINYDGDIQMKNKFYYLYWMLAQLYKRHNNYDMVQFVIQIFQQDNKKSLKLIPFQVSVLIYRKLFKQAYRKIKIFQNSQQKSQKLNFQQQKFVEKLFNPTKKEFIKLIDKQIQDFYQKKNIEGYRNIERLLKQYSLTPEQFQFYLQRDVDYARCMVRIGRAYQEIQKYEEAILYMKKALLTEALTTQARSALQKEIYQMKNKI